MILDEGHFMKNFESQRYNKLMRLRAKHRLLMTGTPLQNDLNELLALLTFIMPNLFLNSSTELQRIFNVGRTAEASVINDVRNGA